VQTACCVVNIHFVLEFECEVCADVVFVCYNNDELLVSSIEGICHYWDSRRQRTAVGLACSLYRGDKICTCNFGGKLLGRLEGKWDDNIKMDVREISSWCGIWMDFPQGIVEWLTLVLAMLTLGVSLPGFPGER